MSDKRVDSCNITHIGGQALIEGIMMRGKYNWAVAVRRPDGKIHAESHDLPEATSPKSWKKKPIIRGCVALWESLSLSFKALEIAANNAYDDEGETAHTMALKAQADAGADGDAGDDAATATAVAAADEAGETEGASDPAIEVVPAEVTVVTDAAEPAMSGKEIAVALVGGIGLAILLFVILPAVLTNLIVGDYGKGSFVWNLVDGILRVVAFVAYVWAISFVPDIKRMFAYHGAEHKTIHAFEHGQDLTVENIRQWSTQHVRCGTAFILMALVLSILVFTLVPIRQMIDAAGVESRLAVFSLVLLSRIVLVPLIAGLAYEVSVKWAGSRAEQALVRIVLWPGLMMQRLTTQEPDDGMLEVAIAATELVVAREAEIEAGRLDTAVAPVPAL